MMYFEALAKKYNFSLDTPVKNLDKKIVHLLLYGTDGGKNQNRQGKNEYGQGNLPGRF